MAPPKERPKGLDSPVVRKAMKCAGRAHVWVYRRTAEPVERAALWPRLVEMYADFDNNQSWTEREIPVVVLEPR